VHSTRIHFISGGKIRISPDEKYPAENFKSYIRAETLTAPEQLNDLIKVGNAYKQWNGSITNFRHLEKENLKSRFRKLRRH